MNINFSTRLNSIAEYYFATKTQEIAQMERNGIKVINLAIGNPNMKPDCTVIEELCTAAQNKDNHGYMAHKGIPELREAYSDFYKKYFNVEIDPETEVQPLIGSKEGIFYVSYALLEKEDSVLLPNPSYPIYNAVSTILGVTRIFYDLTDENGWLPDFDELEKLDLSKVKLMWMCYPHAPTGANATLEFFKKAVAFAKKHNIVIVNDNPYSFVLNKGERLSLLAVDGAKDCCVEFNSLSKSHAMAGWRLGAAFGNHDIIAAILKLKSNIDTSQFKAIQLAAIKAMSLDDEWLNNLTKTYSERREVAWKLADMLNLTYSKDVSGMYVWAKLPEKYSDDYKFVDTILHKTGVFITPGSMFGSMGKGYLRISLVQPKEVFEEVIKRINKLEL